MDPLGKNWAIYVDDPNTPGSRHPLVNLAVDGDGKRYLLRQGKLSSAGPNISAETFRALTGLPPVEVEASGADAVRTWFVVAELDQAAAQIRRATGRFVHKCAAVRSDATTSPPQTTDVRAAGDETGGTYQIGARPALDEQTVLRRHGIVYLSLAEVLLSRGIRFGKLAHPLGFEIDGEVICPGGAPLLLEIKTSVSAADIHAGVGQLHLYRKLIPDLALHRPVLLLPRDPHPDVKAAIEATGVTVHRFEFVATGEGGEVSFSVPFLALCGL